MVLWIDVILLSIVFLVIYTLVLYYLLLFESRKKLYKKSTLKKLPRVSLVIPAYNERKYIIKSLERILKINYPKEKLEIIIVDDGSTDGTFEIVKKFVDTKKLKFIKIFKNKHSGKAGSLNFGVKRAKHDFVAVVDADSHLTRNTLINAMKYFDSEDVASVTTRILVEGKKTIFERWQDIEFKIIALMRKITESLNLISVTPGPLSIYKKNILLKVGLFDKKNLTEDIEIAWRLLNEGYRINMAYDSLVYTPYPSKFSKWFRQRLRWSIGWMQTLKKYSVYIFRNHPVGTYLLPMNLASLVFQMVILGLFLCLSVNWVVSFLFYLKDTIILGAPIIFRIPFIPDIFTFYVLLILVLSIFIAIYTLRQYKQRVGILDFISFLIVYVYLFIPVTIYSLIKILTGKYSWFTK